jgi:hypothetical protein
MALFETEGTMESQFSTPMGRTVHRDKPLPVPILEPSVFEDDDCRALEALVAGVRQGFL